MLDLTIHVAPWALDAEWTGLACAINDQVSAEILQRLFGGRVEGDDGLTIRG
jgi:hypothetical protein